MQQRPEAPRFHLQADGLAFARGEDEMIEIPPGADPAINAARDRDTRGLRGRIVWLLLHDLGPWADDEGDGIGPGAGHVELYLLHAELRGDVQRHAGLQKTRGPDRLHRKELSGITGHWIDMGD